MLSFSLEETLFLVEVPIKPAVFVGQKSRRNGGNVSGSVIEGITAQWIDVFIFRWRDGKKRENGETQG